MRKGFYNNKGLPGYKVGWGDARKSFLIEFSSPAGGARERERERAGVSGRALLLPGAPEK
jgi:hypothetical protein